eukprot:CAMPEP_0174231292 /NCGR_PEP_ID=MMETSP0417-20130205/1853_1 /TAXON_ID=242541 /ORGANISM="Mayorella sp, Strain BSH-02190019" /LENGTH=96 /DNA_ID=CAMNT_0015309147 /DNA_START=8 /DNA_END=294 /DNA_ORIENTATION=+
MFRIGISGIGSSLRRALHSSSTSLSACSGSRLPLPKPPTLSLTTPLACLQSTTVPNTTNTTTTTTTTVGQTSTACSRCAFSTTTSTSTSTSTSSST